MHKSESKTIRLKQTMETYLTSPLVKSFLAGSFSGTCSTILFQPLDRVKTLLQCGCKPDGNGVLHVAAYVIRTEKLQGLWRGITPSLTRTVPGIGVYFCSLHTIRSHFGSTDPHPLESLAIGGTARSISGLSMLPFTVIKTRFESGQFKEYKGITEALIMIYKKEGLKGLFSGTSATLLRDAPFSGLYLMFYSQTKKFVKTSGLAEQQTPVTIFSCGVIAGCLASVVTQPADVVKTHMQMNKPECRTVYDAIYYTYQTEGGMRGFFVGIVPRTLRRTLMAAMAWTVYEQVMSTVGLK